MKKYKWMNENIEMIYYFINKLMIFINDNGQDFKLNTDNESFNENFANFLYDKYYSNKDFGNIEYDNNFDYFDTKFCSDISDLFLDMKNIAYGFTNDIFKDNNNSYDLIEFIYRHITLNENFNEIKDDLSEEDNLDEEYYYTRL